MTNDFKELTKDEISQLSELLERFVMSDQYKNDIGTDMQNNIKQVESYIWGLT